MPTLVVLIANHYRGEQQAKALGWLGSARAMAGVLAFLIIGTLERLVSWRVAFGLLIVHAAAILLLSFKLKPSSRRPEVKIDVFGVLLVSSRSSCISFGFNNLRNWGSCYGAARGALRHFRPVPGADDDRRRPRAPSAFLVWTRKRVADNKTPLFALEVVEEPPRSGPRS